MQETKQVHLVRDQPRMNVNACPCCTELPKLYESSDGSFLLKCFCTRKITVPMFSLNDTGTHLLTALWNIDTTRAQWSEAMKKQLDVTNNDLLVYDIRDYSFLAAFPTLLDAMTFMEQRFLENMEQRTALFQLQENNKLEWIMKSDELWEN